MTAALIHGFVLALGLILPLGPQNAFVLSQGVSQPSLLRAAPVVVAASLCDTLLIVAAVAGVSVAVMQLAWLQTVLILGGIAFLVVIGWLTWRNGAEEETAPEAKALPLPRQLAFVVAVSLGNPHAIIDTALVIGTSSLAYREEALVAFTASCVGVSWLWFLGLAATGRVLGRSALARRLLNKASAVVMWASAAYLAVSSL